MRIIARVANDSEPLFIARQVTRFAPGATYKQLILVMHVVEIRLTNRSGAIKTLKIEPWVRKFCRTPTSSVSCNGDRSCVMSWAINCPKKGQPAAILWLSSPIPSCTPARDSIGPPAAPYFSSSSPVAIWLGSSGKSLPNRPPGKSGRRGRSLN